MTNGISCSCVQGEHSSGEIQVIGGDNFEKLRGKVRVSLQTLTVITSYLFCMWLDSDRAC